MNHEILIAGLVIALFMPTVVLELCGKLRLNLPAFGVYTVPWVTSAIVVAIAVTNTSSWRETLGITRFTSRTVYWGIPAMVIALAVVTVNIYLPRWIGYRSPKQKALFQGVLHYPFWQRCFFLVSAAVTEEVLFRAYAVGIGAEVLGSVWLAGALSIIVFTLTHFRFGIPQLPFIFVIAVMVTVIFVATGNLWLCILVHAILDGSILAKPTPDAQCGTPSGETTG